MRVAVRWILITVVALHGLVHLLGAAKGLGGAEVSQLGEPIGSGAGVVWLAAASLLVGTALLWASSVEWWWRIGAVALVASQVSILTSWTDAGVGTVANAVLLAAVVHGGASSGRRSYRAEFRRRSQAALARVVPDVAVSEADLARLPDPVAAYVRASGAVGQAHVRNLHAYVSGRLRGAPTERWMTFRGEQVSTFGAEFDRLFFIDATARGVPVDVLHVFAGPSATMRVKVASLLRLIDAHGPQMDQGETVTVFNDLCVLAPAALLDAPVVWQTLDRHHVRGSFTRGVHTVAAELTFNDAHELVDFVSDDRLRASADGRRFVPQRWSTPLQRYRTFGARRLATLGEGRWHAPAPEGEFPYIDFQVDDIAYNVEPLGSPQRLRADREIP